MSTDSDTLRRIHLDVLDSYDEELELEMDDRSLDAVAAGDGDANTASPTEQDKQDRQR